MSGSSPLEARRGPRGWFLAVGEFLDDMPRWLFWGLFFAAAWFHICRRIVDWDIWWHLAHARFWWEHGDWTSWWCRCLPWCPEHACFIWEHGVFPPNDTFTFGVVNGQYEPNIRSILLGDLVLFFFRKVFGLVGLQILPALHILFVVYVFMRLVRFRHNVWTLAGCVLMVLGTLQIHLVRNALFCMLFLGIIVLTWAKLDLDDRPWPRLSRPRDWRWLLLLVFPAVMLLWTRMHGSTLVGLGVLFCILIGATIDTAVDKALGRDRGRTWGFVLAFAVAFFLTNQFTGVFKLDIASTIKDLREVNTASAGPAQPPSASAPVPPPAAGKTAFKSRFRFVFRGGDSDIVAEYQSPFDITYVISARALFMYCTGVLLFFAYLALFRPEGLRFSLLVPIAVTGVLGLGYLRTICFPFLVGLPFLGAVLVLTRAPGREHGLERAARAVLGFLLLLALLAVTYMQWEFFLKKRFQRLTGFIDTEVGYGKSEKFRELLPQWVLKNVPKEERLFNSYNIGGYLTYEWYTDRKVFIDGRSAIYEEKFYTSYKERASLDYIDKWKIEKMLLSLYVDKDRLAFYMRCNWSPVVFDTSMVLLQRARNPEAAFGTVPVYIAEESRLEDLDFVDSLGMGIFLRNTVNFLLLYGRLQDAKGFFEKNAFVFKYLDPAQQQEINEKKQFLDGMLQTFGPVNHLALGELCQKFFQKQEDPEIRRVQVADTLARLERPEQAAQEYLAYLKSRPNSPDVLSRLATQLYRLGKKQEALQALTEAMRIDPRNADHANNAGLVFYSAGQPEDAARLFRRALELDPRNALAHHNLGSLLEDGGRHLEAVAEYRAALECKPDFQESRKRLDRLLATLSGNQAPAAGAGP